MADLATNSNLSEKSASAPCVDAAPSSSTPCDSCESVKEQAGAPAAEPAAAVRVPEEVHITFGVTDDGDNVFTVTTRRPIVSEEGVVLGEESEAEVQRLLSAGVVNLDDDSDSDASRDPDERTSESEEEEDDEDEDGIVGDDETVTEEADEEEDEEEMDSADAVTSDDEASEDSDPDWKPPPRPKRQAAADAAEKISECAQLDAFDTAAAAAVMDELSRESAKAEADGRDGHAEASIAETALRSIAKKGGPKALKVPEDEEAFWRTVYRAGHLSESLIERLVRVRAEEASARRAKAQAAVRKREQTKAREAEIAKVAEDTAAAAVLKERFDELDAIKDKVLAFVGESALAESVPLQQPQQQPMEQH